LRRTAALVVAALAALALVSTLVSAGASSRSTTSVAVRRVVASPDATGTAWASVELPKVKAPVAAKPAPRHAAAAPRVQAADVQAPKPLPVPVVGLEAFKGLGSWIDVFDYNDDPSTVVPLVRSMAKQGVRTLYLETSRYQSPTDIQFPHALGAALDEAKLHGMRVVSWYPPAFDDVNRDVRRSIAAVKFVSPKGHRFDAFASDIEYTQNVPDHTERSKRTVEYSERLRAGAGGMRLAAITIAPTSLELNTKRWPDFPWKALSSLYDVFMPMNYWTAHGKSAATATDLTRRNVVLTNSLTGRPVHIIGGLGADADLAQVHAYVTAARAAGSLGGGLYDFTTTRSNVWGELRRFNA